MSTDARVEAATAAFDDAQVRNAPFNEAMRAALDAAQAGAPGLGRQEVNLIAEHNRNEGFAAGIEAAAKAGRKAVFEGALNSLGSIADAVSRAIRALRPAAQAGAPDWQQLEEWIVMADNRLEVADCPGCVDVARSYLQEALTTIRSLRPAAPAESESSK